MKNEVEVPDHAWLVRQPKCAVNLYYLAAKEVNQSSIPSVVEMMLVSETDPSDRFKKLICKGRLEEAEVLSIIDLLVIHYPLSFATGIWQAV